MEIMKTSFIKKLENILGASLKIDETHVTFESNPGDNYVSEAFCLRIIGHIGPDNTPYVKNIFIKRIPRSLIMNQTKFLHEQAFNNEKLFYLNVLKNAKILPCVPEFLGADADTIVLQDLLQEGFKATDRKSLLSSSHIKLILEELAKLHSCSFLMKRSNKTLFVDITSHLKPYVSDDDLNRFYTSAFDACINVLNQERSGSYDDVIEVLQKYSGNVVELINNRHRSNKSIYNLDVIIHGDCWLPNILFRYCEDIPIKACLIDFQNVRVASLVIDLITVIWVNTQERSDYEKLLKFYHESLSVVLKSLDIESPEFDAIKREFESCFLLGFITSLLYMTARYIQPVTEQSKYKKEHEDLSNKVEITDPAYAKDIKELADFFKKNMIKT